jgi:hypothetical protein
MKIHKPSTLIKMKLSGIDAYIFEAIIGNDYILYKVSYFHNGESRTTVLAEYEFEIVNGSKKQIGFK